MICDVHTFHNGIAYEHTCRRCGTVYVTDMPRHVVRCGKRDGPCIHRGTEVSRQSCPSCRGNVQVKIYRCNLYHRCTIAKTIGLAVCAACPDNTPRTSGEPA